MNIDEIYTTDTPTSLYYINTPPSLYDGGAYAGGCKLGMGISDGCSMHPPSPLYTTQCIYILNTGKHTRRGCAYTNIDYASQDTGKGVCVQLSTHLCARVVYTVDTPTSLYR